MNKGQVGHIEIKWTYSLSSLPLTFSPEGLVQLCSVDSHNPQPLEDLGTTELWKRETKKEGKEWTPEHQQALLSPLWLLPLVTVYQSIFPSCVTLDTLFSLAVVRTVDVVLVQFPCRAGISALRCDEVCSVAIMTETAAGEPLHSLNPPAGWCNASMLRVQIGCKHNVKDVQNNYPISNCVT